jgi:acyl-CoA synthetase (AMP-forming)/AMP-acid ligase II
VEDEQWGQRVTALVSLEPGPTRPSEDEIRAHARSKVAGYKVPKEVFVVERIFRAPNGKADYKLSKQLARELSAGRAAS